MRSIHVLLGLLSCSVLGWPAWAQTVTESQQKVTVSTTELIPFANSVSVHLKDTFGEVHVEGWDRNEVEVRLTRSTQKKYAAAAYTSQARRLEKIKLLATKDPSGNLLVETKKLPFLTKNNLALEYKVKVPQGIYLKIKHSISEPHKLYLRVGIGEVQVKKIVIGH